MPGTNRTLRGIANSRTDSDLLMACHFRLSNMKSNDPYFYVGGQRCTSRCKMAHMHTRRPTNMYREREREHRKKHWTYKK